MNPSPIEAVATAFFALAIAHTFLVSRFQTIAHRFESGSIGENFFHLLGEVEVVFGLWAGLFVLSFAIIAGPKASVEFTESLNFTEPLFVFAIMTVAATSPVIAFAKGIIFGFSSVLPVKKELGAYFSCLTIGPLLGSLITEPASMTVTALILKDRFFLPGTSSKMKYLTIAVLFVNVSIGGVLTHFAAPPVLMVAGKWGWGIAHMLSEFGWKAAIAVLINSALAALILKRELVSQVSQTSERSAAASIRIPKWLIAGHLCFLALIVLSAHHPVIFIGLLLFFLGVTAVTAEHQEPLKLKESLLVAFFLAGLVVLGGPQKWWLQQFITGLNDVALFLSAAGLTAFTDNAALTFLGSQIESITDAQKYALVAGAVAAGGLTVIANAPNPAGYTILQERFGPDGIRPLALLLYALGPTLVAVFCFWFL